MALISQNVDVIRSAVYGVETRTPIADSLQQYRNLLDPVSITVEGTTAATDANDYKLVISKTTRTADVNAINTDINTHIKSAVYTNVVRNAIADAIERMEDIVGDYRIFGTVTRIGTTDDYTLTIPTGSVAGNSNSNTSNIQNIRSATSGKIIREAIADGVEQMKERMVEHYEHKIPTQIGTTNDYTVTITPI